MADHIRIGDIAPRIQYTANGTATRFTYPFPVFRDADVIVYLNGTRQTAGFAISGAGQSLGGAVTFNAAPAHGALVTLLRKIAIRRTTDFQESGEFRAKVINDELDKIIAMIQQVADNVARTVQLPPASTNTAALALPDPEINKVLGWNATADGLENKALKVTGATARTVAEGAPASVSYDDATGVIAFGIPAGATGATGSVGEMSGANNLSELTDRAAARTVLDVYAKGEVDALDTSDQTARDLALTAYIKADIRATDPAGVYGDIISDNFASDTIATKTNAVYDATGACYTNAHSIHKNVFQYTGSDQDFIVPVGVTSMSVKGWGAGGGGSNQRGYYDYGGAGGFVSGIMAVLPGMTLKIVVGQGGTTTGPATYGGGGNSQARQTASGGGLSGVFQTTVTQANARAIAGGGGGGANTHNNAWSGGAGGGMVGEAGRRHGNYGSGPGAGGGTQSAGGAAYRGGQSGSALRGGDAVTIGGDDDRRSLAGGGGGGYFGGGTSKLVSGGGGGSGYSVGLASARFVISTNHYGPPNTTDADYVSGIAAGALRAAGGNGLVVLEYTTPRNMTLRAPAVFLARPNPTDLSLYFRVHDIDAVTNGTDRVIRASIDGGTTWATASITEIGSYGGTDTLLRADANVSAQTGRSFIWEITTANIKQQKIKQVAMVPLY